MLAFQTRAVVAGAIGIAGSVAGSLLLLAACSSNSSAPPVQPPPPQPPPMFQHPDVALLDAAGEPLAVGATVPYSPRATCGRCHPIDEIANGYHFQQGRTDASGKVIVKSDFFGDRRAIVRSEGMYGKW